MKKINLIELYADDLQERIKTHILNILKIFFPEIKEAFNKYSKQKLDHPKEFAKRNFHKNIKREELDEIQKEILKNTNYPILMEKNKGLNICRQGGMANDYNRAKARKGCIIRACGLIYKV